MGWREVSFRYEGFECQVKVFLGKRELQWVFSEVGYLCGQG